MENTNEYPDLYYYADLIWGYKEEKRKAEANILKMQQQASKYLGKLKTGDIVEYSRTKERYVILEKLPEVVVKDSSIRSENDPIEYDLEYTGLLMRKNGEPFYDSRSDGSRRHKVYQSFLERGIVSVIGFYDNIEKRAGKYSHL